MMGMQVGKRINIVPFLGVQSNQVSFDWATKSKVVFTFSVPKNRTIFFRDRVVLRPPSETYKFMACDHQPI